MIQLVHVMTMLKRVTKYRNIFLDFDAFAVYTRTTDETCLLLLTSDKHNTKKTFLDIKCDTKNHLLKMRKNKLSLLC